MSERITGAMLRSATLTDLNAALSAMERSSNELSSGKSILAPSDNPYGASHAIDLQSQLDGLHSYATNAQDGISWATTAESSMANISTVLQQAREILVQAGNGTYTPGDLNTLASQVEQITQTVKQDANTQYAGQYVFAGTATTTPPYQQGESDTFAGNHETVTRAIAPGASVTVSTDISTLLGNGQAAKDGKLLDTLRTIAQQLREGTAESRAALGSSSLKALDGNMETLTQLQATTGGAVDQLQMATSRIEALQVAIAKTLSNTQDADVAKTTIAFSSEQAAYTAALRAGASIVQESLLNFLH